jgi:hypothetical protein
MSISSIRLRGEATRVWPGEVKGGEAMTVLRMGIGVCGYVSGGAEREGGGVDFFSVEADLW